LMDEFKEEREALKNADFKTKWDYFWEYNKTKVFIIGIFAFLIIGYLYSVVTQKEDAIFVAMLNSVPGSEESIAKGSAPVAIPDFTHGLWMKREKRPGDQYSLDQICKEAFE